MARSTKWVWAAFTAIGIVAAGEHNANAFSETIRYTTSGSIDFQTPLGGGSFDAGTAVQVAGGNTVLGGYFFTGSQAHLIVGRLTPAGQPDPMFGYGGVTTFQLDPDASEKCVSLAVDSTGRIVVLGLSIDDPDGSVENFVIRFNSNGTVDTGFGTKKPFVNAQNQPLPVVGVAVRRQSTGSIVVLATDVTPDETGFTFARYNDSGSQQGSLVTSNFAPGIGNVAFDLAISETDGKFVVVGESPLVGGKQLMGVVRFNSSGTIDTGFGTQGKKLINFGLVHDQGATGVTFDGSNRIIVVGRPRDPADSSTGSIVLAARLKALDGAVDRSTLFAFSGTTVGPTNIPNWDVGMANGTDFYVAGNARVGSFEQFATTRFVGSGSTFAVDTSFNGGKVLTGITNKNAIGKGIWVGTDGKPVVTGSATP